MQYIELNIADTYIESLKLAKIIAVEYKPDLVAYLARGGYLIGNAVSSYFSVPMVEISKHHKSNIVKNQSCLSKLPFHMKSILRAIEIKLRLAKHTSVLKNDAAFTCRYRIPTTANKVLLVDDSVDTGASVRAAIVLLKDKYPNAEIKIATFNVFDKSTVLTPIDWSLYRNTLMSMPTSRDNREYRKFCGLYESASQ